LHVIVAHISLFAPVAVSSRTRRMSSRLAAAASARRGRTDAGSALLPVPLGVDSEVSAATGACT
jgi:hypothetical protein